MTTPKGIRAQRCFSATHRSRSRHGVRKCRRILAERQLGKVCDVAAEPTWHLEGRDPRETIEYGRTAKGIERTVDALCVTTAPGGASSKARRCASLVGWSTWGRRFRVLWDDKSDVEHADEAGGTYESDVVEYDWGQKTGGR